MLFELFWGDAGDRWCAVADVMILQDDGAVGATGGGVSGAVGDDWQ